MMFREPFKAIIGADSVQSYKVFVNAIRYACAVRVCEKRLQWTVQGDTTAFQPNSSNVVQAIRTEITTVAKIACVRVKKLV